MYPSSPTYFAWEQMNLNTLVLAKLTKMVSSLRQHTLVLLTSAQLCTDPSALALMNSLLLDLLQYRCSATGNSSQKSFPASLPSYFLAACSPPLQSPVTSSCLWGFPLWLQKHSLFLKMRLTRATCGRKNSDLWRLEDHKISSQEEHYCNTVSIAALQGSSYLPRNSEKQKSSSPAVMFPRKIHFPVLIPTLLSTC